MIAPATRRLIWERDGGRCGFCDLPVVYEEMEVDHILPRYQGGSDEDHNLRPAHRWCNRGAGGRIAGQMRGDGDQGFPDRECTIVLRLPRSLRDTLKRLAKAERRSLNSCVLVVLERLLAERPDDP